MVGADWKDTPQYQAIHSMTIFGGIQSEQAIGKCFHLRQQQEKENEKSGMRKKMTIAFVLCTRNEPKTGSMP